MRYKQLLIFRPSSSYNTDYGLPYIYFFFVRYDPLKIAAAAMFFLFQQPSGPGKKFAFFWRADGERVGGWGGYHLTFRRTEGVITRNWEPLKKKSLKKNQGNWIQKDDSNLLDKASFRAYKINASILLGGKSVCSLNLL